ncbi:MAG TPA: TolC family protein, partial [Humisphaera sp.]
FSAGIIEADVRAAWSRLRQAALSESYLRRQVLNDVRQAYQNVATADRKRAEYEQQVRAAREALEQSRSALNNGLAINLDVLVAQDQVLNAELQLTGTEFDRTVFYLDLIRATGRLQEATAAALAKPVPAPATAPTTGPTTASTTGPTAKP